MLRLTANKTKLYTLVADYLDNLPPMRKATFTKYPRTPDYALEWATEREKGRALSAAMAASPWVWRLQQADMCAAWVDEREAAEE